MNRLALFHVHLDAHTHFKSSAESTFVASCVEWDLVGIHVSRLKAQITMIISPQSLGAFASEHRANWKLQNHEPLERALAEFPGSASLLSQPAQLSIELNHQGQDSRQLFDRCVTVEPFTMMSVGSNTASVYIQCICTI